MRPLTFVCVAAAAVALLAATARADVTMDEKDGVASPEHFDGGSMRFEQLNEHQRRVWLNSGASLKAVQEAHRARAAMHERASEVRSQQQPQQQQQRSGDKSSAVKAAAASPPPVAKEEADADASLAKQSEGFQSYEREMYGRNKNGVPTRVLVSENRDA